MAALSDLVTDELYKVAPRDFTARRDARALEARRAGDRQLAKEIKGLRRPTTSAWMANWLARECPVELGHLIELGAALRAAQDALEGEDLRRLSRRRQEGVVALSGRARAAALTQDIAVTEEAVRDLHDTLNAAVTDPDAAAAVRAGRLTTAVHHSGFGLPDLSDRFSGSGTSSAPPAAGATTPPVEADQRRQAEVTDAQERADRLETARSGLRLAESDATDARLRLDEARDGVAHAQRRHDAVRASISEIEARLNVLRGEEGVAGAELDAAMQAREALREVSRAAEERLTQCRRDVERERG